MAKKVNAAVNIYRILLRRITMLEYAPGCIISEGDLAMEFQVSKTPVREALHRLEQERLVRIIPKIGVQISNIDLHEMRMAFDVRRTMSSMSALLASTRATDEDMAQLKGLLDELNTSRANVLEGVESLDDRVHDAVYRIARNDVLHEIHNMLHIRFKRLNQYTRASFNSDDTLRDTLRRLIEALIAKDSAQAKMAAEAHIDQITYQIRSSLL